MMKTECSIVKDLLPLYVEDMVSEETALEMAQRVRKLFGSDYGVGITGNAGPGGSEGKPVGLVYIAIASPDEVYCKEFNFTSTRIENKLRIALTAISMVIDKLKVN